MMIAEDGRRVDEFGCDALCIHSWSMGRGWANCGACGWRSPIQHLNDPSMCLLLTWCEVHRGECPDKGQLPEDWDEL